MNGYYYQSIHGKFWEVIMNLDYGAIIHKIEAWIYYNENAPKEKSYINKSEYYKDSDKFRKENDLDCQLTEGNLFADTIFSLWLPLRFSLLKINGGYTKLNKYGKVDKNDCNFLRGIINNIEELLPYSKEITKLLIDLFQLGQERCNVMILPDRSINTEKGKKPYYDYMPYFLLECFESGNFSKYFHYKNEELKKWIVDQKLEMFFDGEISKNKIKDLAGNGNITYNGGTEHIETILKNYITILKCRKDLLKK